MLKVDSGTKMSWQTKLDRMSNVLLRIPPLFIMDSILNASFLSFYFPHSHLWTDYFVWILIMSLFFLIALTVFVLGLRQLQEVYNYIFATSLLYASYRLNYNFTIRAIHGGPVVATSAIFNIFEGYFRNICIQACLSYLFWVLWTFRLPARLNSSSFIESLLEKAIYVFFLLPSTISIKTFYQYRNIFQYTPHLALILPGFILAKDLLSALSSMFFIVKRFYGLCLWTIQEVGVQGLLENQWIRLHIPKVLRLFWLSRFTYQLVVLYLQTCQGLRDKGSYVDCFNGDVYLTVGKQLLIQSCETVIALLGLTSIVSVISHYLGLVMANIVGSETEEDRNMGTVSAVLFFILALQTGLTGLEPEKRLLRLNRNFCLLSTAILHFIHSMVNPLLLSLSASRSMCIQRHLRVLGMCLFLFVFPMWLLYCLWNWHDISTWLLAVTAFSIEVMIKVVISVLVYALFMIDAYMDRFWEKLDDYVYYIQSTGNTIEFLFGIFLFCNGAWIMVFESGGTIRAVMMCIHAYFNIWLQAKEGWKVFMKRRTAVNKINLLLEATSEQLKKVNDVCAICYQELNSARITHCNHYFHGVCLRKWLYVQDNCPLCHEVIYNPENENQLTNLDEMNQNAVGINQDQPNNTHNE